MCWFTGLSSCIVVLSHVVFFFFFNDTATTEIYTLSLHDALPISAPLRPPQPPGGEPARRRGHGRLRRAAAGRRLRRRGLRRPRVPPGPDAGRGGTRGRKIGRAHV